MQVHYGICEKKMLIERSQFWRLLKDRFTILNDMSRVLLIRHNAIWLQNEWHFWFWVGQNLTIDAVCLGAFFSLFFFRSRNIQFRFYSVAFFVQLSHSKWETNCRKMHVIIGPSVVCVSFLSSSCSLFFLIPFWLLFSAHRRNLCVGTFVAVWTWTYLRKYWLYNERNKLNWKHTEFPHSGKKAVKTSCETWTKRNNK